MNIILIGPSGSGKTTILERVAERFPGLFVYPKGVWTREQRPGEDGKDSRTISVVEFLRMMVNDELTAYAEIHGNFYGMPKSEFIDARDAGLNTFRILSVDGVERLLRDVDGMSFICIFLDAPIAILRERLEARGDSPESIERRMETAERELEYHNDYDIRIDATLPLYTVVSQIFSLIEDVARQEEGVYT